MQSSLTYRTNRDLFSNYYLDEHLPETEEWDEVDDDELEAAYDEIVDLYDREKSTAPKRNESQLEEKFIRPMFRKLGIPFEVEESTSRTQRRPDYGFFETEDAARDAFERREGGGDFYENAVAVADAKRWGRPLDTRGSGEHERDFENPSYQIHVYLQETPARWAVLTDGKKWRLYYGPTSHRLDSYYEVDLPTVLEKGDLEDFKYFYLFFRHGAFLEDSSGDCFLDDVYGESNVFAQDLGEDLQDNIYEAIKILSEGYLQYPDNDLDEDDLDLVHDSSLIYLYRLIFVLYAEAEGRDLLDTDNEIYEQSYSLNSLKQEVAEEVDSGDPKYRDWQDDLSSRLDELFELIDQGSKSRGIPKEDLHIPAYNGGLFRTDPDEDDDPEARFLAEHTVGDAYLARVIELLTRSKQGNGGGKIFVDYSSLDVRHLGSIYEGLLEYQLHVADGPLALDDDEYIEAEENDEVAVEEGEVYLTTGSGERKATGSYYTPEYVVEYIVDETLGPLVDDIREDLVGYDSYSEGGFAEEFAERIFELKILDPAMGSGHFLTSAVDYLAREIIDAQERQAAQQGIKTVDEDHDINWARRKVAQRCIYGVDLNPLATELAKVSLWLRTLAAEQPLAFLDHHLKTGNSLVSSDIEDVLVDGDEGGDAEAADVDGQVTFTQFFDHARQEAIAHVMERFQDLLAIDNETLADAKEMEDVYDEVRDDPLYQHLLAMANVHTADQFGLDVPGDSYERMARALQQSAWDSIEEQDWFKSAQEMADNERFFHWELEFPIAFYEQDGVRKEDGGFDAVIGNPPYGADINDQESKYYNKSFDYQDYQLDSYLLFIERNIDLADSKGLVGIIVPKTWLSNLEFSSIRNKIISGNTIENIVYYDYPVFSDVIVNVVTFILQKGTSKKSNEIDITLDREDEIEKYQIPQQRWEGNEEDPFNIFEKPAITDLADKLRRFSEFGEAYDITLGAKTFQKGKGDPPQTKEIVEEKPYVSNEKENSEFRPLLRGSQIQRYRMLWENDYWINFGDHLAEPRRSANYDAEKKIVIRRTDDSLKATIDTEQFVITNSGYTVIPVDEENDLGYALSVLNSKLYTWYYQNILNPEVGEALAEIKRRYLTQLPLYIVEDSVENDETLSELENKYGNASKRELISDIKREATDADKQKFLSILSDKITDLKSKRGGYNLNLLDHLGIPSDHLPDSLEGNTLGNLQMPVAGIADTPMTKTEKEYEGLRIERVTFEDNNGRLVLSVDISYKVDEDDPRETDRWDRLAEPEFETYETMAFVGLSEAEEALLREFIPVAVEKGSGFAGFRRGAAGTISPLDRLKEMTIPDIDEIQAELEQYMKMREHADELEEKIEKTDQLIDEIIYDLYGLTDEEIEIIESDVQNDRY